MDEITEYNQLVTSAFEKLAPVYDLIALPVWGVRQQVAKLLPLDSTMNVLDVATGTGAQAFAFAKRGHHVAGIDLTEGMLNVARRHNKDSLVSFQVGDATNLPFQDSQFDVCSISFALHDMPLAIRESVLMEMVRVAKPDGLILIVDYALPKNELGRFLIHRLISLYESEYYQQFIRSDLEELLRHAGIHITEERTTLLGAARILIGSLETKIAATYPATAGELVL